MMPQVLPLKTIGESLHDIETWTPSCNGADDEFDYIDISSVDREKKQITLPTRVTCTNAPSRARQLVRVSDVLVSTVRPNLNGVAIVPPNLDGATASTGYCVLRANPDELDSRYLFYWVQTPDFVRDMARKATGASYPAVSDRIVKESMIPLPPLPEQKRIADILDKADAIRRKRRQMECDTDTLYRSTFYDLFGDPLLNPKGWPIERLGAVAELDRGRSRHRPRDAAFLYGGPYPFVQTGDITNSNGFVQQFSQTYSAEGLAQSKIWSTGTLCITIAANIAKTAILTFDACFPDSVVGLVPSQHLKTEYVRYWFVAMEKAIDSAATQVAQKNINLQILRDLNIQIPPIELQNHFTAAVLRLRTYRERLVHATESSNDLFNSLVQRSFKGEL